MKQTTFGELAIGSVFWYNERDAKDPMMDKRKVTDTEYSYVLPPENEYRYPTRDDSVVFTMHMAKL